VSGRTVMTPDELAALEQAVEARSGVDVDPEWLAVAAAETLTYVRLLAPCKRSEWTSWAALPLDVQVVCVASLSRMASNPRGIRQETIGEYSYTLAGSSSGSGTGTGPFSGAEARVITSASGCGGALKSVHVTAPAPLDIDNPEAPFSDPLGHWEEPSHANGFQTRWVHGR
jgi:hypothetical protein